MPGGQRAGTAEQGGPDPLAPLLRGGEQLVDDGDRRSVGEHEPEGADRLPAEEGELAGQGGSRRCEAHRTGQVRRTGRGGGQRDVLGAVQGQSEPGVQRGRVAGVQRDEAEVRCCVVHTVSFSRSAVSVTPMAWMSYRPKAGWTKTLVARGPR